MIQYGENPHQAASVFSFNNNKERFLNNLMAKHSLSII